MQAKKTLTAALALSLVLVAGCRKKDPVTPAEVVPAPTATPAAPAPAPTAPAAPADPLAGDLASVNDYLSRQGLLGAVHFDYDSADLGAAARDRLAKNAEFLNAHPQFVVAIEGHCDERGTNEYNLALGDRRASSARDYLGRLGVATDTVRTVSYGEERPNCMQPSESCWSQNRRAHFVVVGRR